MKKNIHTLHGLWPSLQNGQYLLHCNQGSDVPINIYDKDLLISMRNFWPSYSSKDEIFWQHEYNKHGYCRTLRTRANGFLPYFKLGMELFKNYNLSEIISDLVENNKKSEIQIKTQDLRKVIDDKLSDLTYDLSCIKIKSKIFLKEVKIYFNLNFQSFTPIRRRSSCPNNKIIYIPKID